MRTFAVHNEFTQLKEALVCRPDNYFQVAPINNVEEYYLKKDPPRREILVEQHQAWTTLLEKLGVRLYFLDSREGLPHQLFTRDVAFAIGEHLYVANMAREVRRKETAVLADWLDREKIPYRKIGGGTLEGGDVLVHFPYVYIGLSQRTNREGIQHLEKFLGSQWKVIPIRLAPEVLHLDCVLAILNPGTVIWCPSLIQSHKPLIRGTFRSCIEISREEAFHMGANVLTVNPDNVLVEKHQKRLMRELNKAGIGVHPLDWSEIKKLGGLFRCASCPLS